jgi:hypothetical protein
MNEFWIVFWGGLLGFTMVAYAGLVFFVTAGGVKDIKAMFHKLRNQDRDE